jgi:ribonucleoside-diphosphate reductase alpha chain
MEVGAWVFKHIDELSGISFLPYSDHTYQQAPYQEISEIEYNEILAKTPTTLDWTWLTYYETSDGTTGSQELACVAGACDINNI